MKQLARFVLNGLVLVVFLAIVWLLLGSAAILIARHDWSVLLTYGCFLVVFIAFVRVEQENRRLKKQIRELELGLGL